MKKCRDPNDNITLLRSRRPKKSTKAKKIDLYQNSHKTTNENEIGLCYHLDLYIFSF